MATTSRSISRPRPVAQECNVCLDLVEHAHRCRRCVFMTCGECLESWWRIAPSQRYKCSGCRQYGYSRFMTDEESGDLHALVDRDIADISEIPVIEDVVIGKMDYIVILIMLASISICSYILVTTDYTVNTEFNILIAVIVGVVFIIAPFVFMLVMLFNLIEACVFKRELSRLQAQHVNEEIV
jgi:hypothetical protein